MTTMNRFGAMLGVVGVLTLGACGTMNDPFNTSGSGTNNPEVVNSGNTYAGYGVVQSIDLVQQGNTGNNLHRFTIRMDNGARQTLTNASSSGFSVGDRVRIDNGSMRKL